ncbi:MAG: S41 family peptidase, partial [Anaerolineales bacterium]
LAVTGLDDGRVIATIVTPDGPADLAGIALGAQIIEFGGAPVEEAVAAVVPWASPFSTEHSRKIQQYRYLTRNPIGAQVTIKWLNPGESETQTATLDFVAERDTFSATSIYAGFDRNALPVEYEILEDSGYGYVRIWTLSDDLNLIIRLFERAVSVFIDNDVPGVIVDLRQNGGGSPLGAKIASYFTTDTLELSRDYYYSSTSGQFETYGPPRKLEPDDELYYAGQVAVLVGPACASACEDVAWVLSQLDQVRVVGQYPSNGIFGEVGRGQYELPGGLSFQIPTGMDVDMNGDIVIEGVGVVPDVRLPITEETVFAAGDPILDLAIQMLAQPLGAGIVPDGSPVFASQSESEAALQNNVPFLDSLAREEYDDSFTARTYTYTVSMPTSRDVIWVFAWSTTTSEQLDQNWDNISLSFSVNDEAVGLENCALLEGNFGGQEWRAYYVLLTDWPRGEHHLTTEVEFEAPINDGSADYEAGTRLFEYSVFVNE